MPLTNISQVLSRNFDLLSGENPLFVNMPTDEFFDDYFQEYPRAKISCFTSDFESFLFFDKRYQNTVNLRFSCEYDSEVKHDLVVISFPKSKAELEFTLAMITPYLTENASIIFVGENKGGIKSAPKLSANYTTACHKVDSARHCSIYVATFNNEISPFKIEDWFVEYSVDLDDLSITVAALPGVFSQKGLDKGTAVLLQNLPESMQGKTLDFGCGAGVISAFIGQKFSDISLCLIDINAYALASAKRTLELNGLSGDVIASNGLSHVKGKYQHIISNPPFHQGIKTHYAATEGFLNTCKTYLQQEGMITIVANSFLNYRPIMEKAIGKTELAITDKGFNVFHCIRSN